MLRTIEALADQIDYLRATTGKPFIEKLPSVNPADQPAAVSGLPLHLSEEEEDITALGQFGHISEAEMEQLAESLRDAGLDLPPIHAQ